MTEKATVTWPFAWQQLYPPPFPPSFFDLIKQSQGILATVVQRSGRWESSKGKWSRNWRGAGYWEVLFTDALALCQDFHLSPETEGKGHPRLDTSTAARQSTDRVTLPTACLLWTPSKWEIVIKGSSRNGEALRHQSHKDSILASFLAIAIAAPHYWNNTLQQTSVFVTFIHWVKGLSIPSTIGDTFATVARRRLL